MLLKWLGHSCFYITTRNGTKILTDPFDGSVGYKVPELATDIVTTSHNHFDHSNVKAIKGGYLRLREAGQYLAHGIEIHGIKSFHDECAGEKRGENVIFKFSIDGINLCHLGDLGQPLTVLQVKALGNVDILLAPIGGIYTIDAAGTKAIMAILKPSTTIPMHYKTAALKFPLAPVENFIGLFEENDYKKIEQSELEITKANLKNLPKILVLDY